MILPTTPWSECSIYQTKPASVWTLLQSSNRVNLPLFSVSATISPNITTVKKNDSYMCLFPSWGFRPLRFPPNQSSKQQHLRAVKLNWQKDFPQGYPWGKSRWKFLLRDPTEFLFCKQFSVFFPLTTKDSNTCSLEGSYDKLSVFSQQRDITLLTKVYIVKSMVFPVVMNGCES